MRKRKINFRNLIKVFFVLSALFLQTTSACSNEQQIWSEKGKNTQALKSQDISRAKNAFVDLAKELNPTVVNVFTTHTVKSRGYGYPDDMFRMLEEMMGGNRRYSQQEMRPRVQRAMALGSGFIINKDGYIVTNSHVIDDADKISVKLYDGKEYDAKIIGVDPETDVALIKINAKGNLPFAPLGDSSKAEVGEWVVAIGNPVGQSNSVTAGIISAKGRLVPDVNTYNDFIQTDAAINPGNSGGPLININGEVIGINAAINRSMGGIPIEGIGFAIPINNVKKTIQMLSKGEKISHKYGWLGVSLGEVTPSLIESLGLADNIAGAVVTEVVPNTPAQRAGLKTYDVITGFDGQPVTSPMDLTMMIKHAQAGKTYVFDLVRDKSQKKINVILGEKKDTETLAKGTKEKGTKDNGATKENKTGVQVKATKEGVVVVDIDENSYAAAAGIMEGDIILEVNKTKISSEADFYRLFKTQGSNIMKIKRGDGVLLIAFSVKGNFKN